MNKKYWFLIGGLLLAGAATWTFLAKKKRQQLPESLLITNKKNMANEKKTSWIGVAGGLVLLAGTFFVIGWSLQKGTQVAKPKPKAVTPSATS